ncbi:hypothetical protein UCRPC4_g04822 [Phaeomoniella chlamydospora]|uniref:Uncharacterized protein n=1 Tax=Phaeomoniella chlamydospora TaxID=158046 RepID=A0A0G2GPL4_PHACM|nr:hypothetical protein UCRPC4_g04822 [Phaeomoniella chlamydospora]
MLTHECRNKLTIDVGLIVVLTLPKATDISQNLHNKVSKAQTIKLLKELHEKKEIENKISANQIVDLDTRISVLHNDISLLRQKEKSLKLEIATLGPVEDIESPSELQARMEELVKAKAELSAEVTEIESKFHTQNSETNISPNDNGKPVPPTQNQNQNPDTNQTNSMPSKQGQEKLQADLEIWKKIAANRKTIVRNMWSIVRDGLLAIESLNSEETGEHSSDYNDDPDIDNEDDVETTRAADTQLSDEDLWVSTLSLLFTNWKFSTNKRLTVSQ